MMGLFCTSVIVFTFICISHSQELSYPRGECDWISADQFRGPYLPIGVCKHIFNPYNLSTPSDDKHYSHKYVCSDDGSKVYSHVWQSDSNCDGDDYDIVPVNIPDDDYFGCSDTKREACPYSVIRFYHQQTPNEDTCIKSSDGWYSEAINTVYQCLNTSEGWYMLQCTEDGRGIIDVEYTENCQEVLNETVVYNGCHYKDMYIEIRECVYWDGLRPTAPMTTGTVTDSAAVSAVIPSRDHRQEHRREVGSGHWHHDSDEPGDGPRRHHDHVQRSHPNDEYHGNSSEEPDESHGRHHHHGYDSEGSSKQEQTESAHGMTVFSSCVIAAVGVVLIFMMFCCCCITYKYIQQRKQIAQFEAIISTDGCKGTDKKEELIGVTMEEGETITFQ